MLFQLKYKITIFILLSLCISGTGFLIQDTHAAAPTFTTMHNSTTMTIVTFSEGVNGTLSIADWSLSVDGLTEFVTITDLQNGTHKSPGIGPAGNNNFINETTTMTIIHAAIPSDSTMILNYTGNENSSGVTTGDSVEDRIGGGKEIIVI